MPDKDVPIFRNRIKRHVRIRAGELVPHESNWRTHPTPQVEAMRGIYEEIGVARSLLAYETPDGRLKLIDGHLRRDLAPDMEVDVEVLDVDESEAKKILATLDPLAAMATADAAKLDALLREVDTGSEALQQMLAGLAESAGEGGGEGGGSPGGGGDEFEAEVEEAGPTRSRLGDLWAIGGKHRLLVGDCTVAENVARLMGGEKPFLMVTDPPYGVEYDPNWRTEAAEKGLISFAARREGKVANDGRVDWTDAYRLFAGSVAYVWHADRHARQLVDNLEAAGFQIRSQIIWRKPTFAISRGHYHWQHEPCWYAFRDGESARWCGDRSQSTVWDITNRVNGEDKNEHGTQKPIECMSRPIRNHGGEGDLIYDPFLGSGTTLIAAHRLNRRCFGCELDPRYADVILRRAEAEGMSCEKVEV